MKRRLDFLLPCLLLFLIYGNISKAEDGGWKRLGDVPRHPSYGEYEVQRGDTLWDISGSFLSDPFNWPVLWKKNPYIRNPHLIYPGDKILIIPLKETVPGKLPVERLQKLEEAAPLLRKEKPKEEAVAAKEVQPAVVKITSPMLERHGLISAREKEGIGVIVGAKGEALLLSEGDIVFISVNKGTPVAKDDHFDIFTTTGEVRHPLTKKSVGFLTETLGVLKVVDIEEGGAITARIEKSYKEILKGAKLKPYEPPLKEVEIKKALTAIEGFIIASIENKVGMAENDLVYLDKGKSSGLEVGHTMNIFRPMAAIKDPLSEEEETISPPPAEVGRLIVIAVEDDTAAAFITSSKQVIYKGDGVKTVE